jgi:hypothetical protein
MVTDTVAEPPVAPVGSAFGELNMIQVGLSVVKVHGQVAAFVVTTILLAPPVEERLIGDAETL